VTGSLPRRAKSVRERVLIRSWEYRQRNHAKGVWFRLRRVLVDAAEVWIVPSQATAALREAGHTSIPVGEELAPPKHLFFVDRDTLETIADRRRIPVRLSSDFLSATDLALIAHDVTARFKPGDQ
jgi:hypothetical protein